jgi:hypothetical protein
MTDQELVIFSNFVDIISSSFLLCRRAHLVFVNERVKMNKLQSFLKNHTQTEQAIMFKPLEGKLLKPDNSNIARYFNGIFDFPNIDHGFIKYDRPPHYISISEMPDTDQSPGQEYKPCIKVKVRLSDDLGGEVYTITNSSKTFLKCIGALYDIWSATGESESLPRVKIARWITYPISLGQIHEPEFEIIDLVNRSAFEAKPPSMRKSNDISRFFTDNPIDDAA